MLFISIIVNSNHIFPHINTLIKNILYIDKYPTKKIIMFISFIVNSNHFSKKYLSISTNSTRSNYSEKK